MGDSQQKAFDTIVSLLASPPVLAYVDFTKPFIVNTDASVEVRTDKNPLTYVTTTAKLDAASHRWLASLSNFNFKLVYRAGRLNGDADGLSRRPYRQEEVFPYVARAVTCASLSTREELPLAETVVLSNTSSLGPESNTLDIGNAKLFGVDWEKQQSLDKHLRRVIEFVREGVRLDKKILKHEPEEVCQYMRKWRLLRLVNPTRNQLASTTARVLYEQFIVHYSFPSRIHSDQGRHFESKVIKELCKIAGVEKTTPNHPIGNGMVERFNQTLLKMLGTIEEEQKSSWKSYVTPLVHAYNATKHETTGYSPHYLMFGWHPRLGVDAFIGIDTSSET
ncbi:uncharacterized protein LOC117320831, partial [Pecten maximus]|uniref:uncharacterized protein LOC117320831 n=1 Tax=Pecten maximus TaxID=6579 RepID=UPI0014583527